MLKFRLHWNDGTVEIIQGVNSGDALNRAGYRNYVPLDYWKIETLTA